MDMHKYLIIELDRRELISIVGGGGKTTVMFHLAKELKALGKKVLISTTTAIWFPSPKNWDHLYLLKDRNKIDISKIAGSSITIIGNKVSQEGKLLGVNKKIIDEIFEENIFDFIIIEADGSKRKPIKAPAEHEPVIPDKTSILVGVIGLDSLGKNINDENVHRSEIFAKVTESNLEDSIDENTIHKLISNNNGLFKEAPCNSDRYLLLNKADDKQRETKALSICKVLKEMKFDLDGTLICSFKNGKILGVK